MSALKSNPERIASESGLPLSFLRRILGKQAPRLRAGRRVARQDPRYALLADSLEVKGEALAEFFDAAERLQPSSQVARTFVRSALRPLAPVEDIRLLAAAVWQIYQSDPTAFRDDLDAAAREHGLVFSMAQSAEISFSDALLSLRRAARDVVSPPDRAGYGSASWAEQGAGQPYEEERAWERARRLALAVMNASPRFKTVPFDLMAMLAEAFLTLPKLPARFRS